MYVHLQLVCFRINRPTIIHKSTSYMKFCFDSKQVLRNDVKTNIQTNKIKLKFQNTFKIRQQTTTNHFGS